MGLSPYASPYDVWLEKTGRTEGFKGNMATEVGTFVEPAVKRWAESRLGKITTRNSRRTIQSIRLATNVDAFVVATGEPVEIKTAGLVAFTPNLAEWGKDSTDEIPAHYIIQCHAHMMTTDKDVCHVPCLLGGKGFVLYRVCRDQRIVDAITEACRNFWTLVEDDTPPADCMPHYENLVRMRREERVAPIDSELLLELRRLQGSGADTNGSVKDVKKKLLLEMGDANVGDGGVAGRLIVKTVETRRFDTKTFKDKHPDLYKEFLVKSESKRTEVKGPIDEPADEPTAGGTGEADGDAAARGGAVAHS